MTATDALELGIDIGLLDCAISVGFPGTVASLRQQWGRAGRRERGLAILVASRRRARPVLRARAGRAALPPRRGGDPRSREPAHPRPARPRRRVRGAARRRRRRRRSAPRRYAAPPSCPELEHTPAGYVWKGRDYPAARVSLRSGDAEAFTVVDGETGSLLGLVERDRAYSTVHEGAVYLHLGEQYLVESLVARGSRRRRQRRVASTGTRRRRRSRRRRSSESQRVDAAPRRRAPLRARSR